MSHPVDAKAKPTGRQLYIGQRLGNYRIVQPLGQGGMGAVFEAVHQYIERKAAVKVLHPDLSQNPQFASRFLNETSRHNLRRKNIDFKARGNGLGTQLR